MCFAHILVCHPLYFLLYFYLKIRITAIDLYSILIYYLKSLRLSSSLTIMDTTYEPKIRDIFEYFPYNILNKAVKIVFRLPESIRRISLLAENFIHRTTLKVLTKFLCVFKLFHCLLIYYFFYLLK